MLGLLLLVQLHKFIDLLLLLLVHLLKMINLA